MNATNASASGAGRVPGSGSPSSPGRPLLRAPDAAGQLAAARDGRPVVPLFAPVVPRGGRRRLRRALRLRRRALAASLALAALVLAAAVPWHGARQVRPGTPAVAGPGQGVSGAEAPAAPLVATPVRLADPAGARLLRPGDAVDVLATPRPAVAAAGDGGPPRAARVARRARVTQLPGGAVLVLAVPPQVAARLAAAAATSELAVARW